jgi:hypothetical protein
MKKSTELANEAMEQADGDVLEATKILEAQCHADMDVWRAITQELLRNACYSACASICRQERRSIWTATNYDAGGNGDRIKQHSHSLMDFPLPGGKVKLRDATKAELEAACSFYDAQANQMAAISAWLALVAQKVKNKTVGESLTEAQLRKLREQSKPNSPIAA